MLLPPWPLFTAFMVASLLPGTLFVGVALVTDTLYAMAAGWIAPHLTGPTARAGRRAGGGIFIGLGLLAALSGQNHPSTIRG